MPQKIPNTKLEQDHSKDFYLMVKRVIYDKIPTAFARYNEWEYGLISKKWFVWAWWYWRTSEVYNKLADDLRNILETDEDWYYIWISSVQHILANKYYKSIVKTRNITFATLFVNNNRKHRNNILTTWWIKEKVVIIWNELWSEAEFPFKVAEYISVPMNVVEYYEYNKIDILSECHRIAQKYKNTLFLFAAWPLSNIMIDCMRYFNKTNRYIDVWSTLDEYIMWRPTRQYFYENSKTFNLVDKL